MINTSVNPEDVGWVLCVVQYCITRAEVWSKHTVQQLENISDEPGQAFYSSGLGSFLLTQHSNIIAVLDRMSHFQSRYIISYTPTCTCLHQLNARATKKIKLRMVKTKSSVTCISVFIYFVIYHIF